jgi:hypothetical protein
VGTIDRGNRCALLILYILAKTTVPKAAGKKDSNA